MSRLVAGLVLASLGLAAAVLSGTGPESLASAPATPGRASTSTAAPTGTVARATTPPPIPPGHRIQIPRLAIDLEILEGDIERDTVQLRTPDGFAFHLPGTAIPGGGANAFIYAHARQGMFLALWEARVGDVVWISTPDGRALRYVVREIHPRVAPGDTSWAAATGPERLTLQTSTGPQPGDPRFIVVASP